VSRTFTSARPKKSAGRECSYRITLSGNVSVTYGRSILLALAEVDGRSQRELSVRLGLHRNVMVAMVDALEA